MKRETVTSVVELGGSAAIVGGASLLSVAVGLITAGGFALVFAWRLTR